MSYPIKVLSITCNANQAEGVVGLIDIARAHCEMTLLDHRDGEGDEEISLRLPQGSLAKLMPMLHQAMFMAGML